MRFIGKFARQKWGFEPTEPFVKLIAHTNPHLDSDSIKGFLRGSSPVYQDLIDNPDIQSKNRTLFENLEELQYLTNFDPNKTLIPIKFLKKIRKARTERDLREIGNELKKSSPESSVDIKLIPNLQKRTNAIFDRYPFLINLGFDASFGSNAVSLDETTSGDKLNSILNLIDKDKFLINVTVNDEYDKDQANASNTYEALKKLTERFLRLRQFLERGDFDEDITFTATPYAGDSKERDRIKAFDRIFGLKKSGNNYTRTFPAKRKNDSI